MNFRKGLLWHQHYQYYWRIIKKASKTFCPSPTTSNNQWHCKKREKKKENKKFSLTFHKNISKKHQRRISYTVCTLCILNTKYSFNFKTHSGVIWYNSMIILWTLTTNASTITNIPMWAAWRAVGALSGRFWRGFLPPAFFGDLLPWGCCWSSSSATNEITPKTNRYQVFYCPGMSFTKTDCQTRTSVSSVQN